MMLLCQLQKQELLHIQAFSKLAVHQCFRKAKEVFQGLLCPSVSHHIQSWRKQRGIMSRTEFKKTF